LNPQPIKKSVERGRQYEKQAEKFLIENGYSIIEKNWQAGHKEIDIIARKKNTIVFVEVKGSTTMKYGHPSEKVDRRKQDFLISAAEQFILAKDLKNCDFRFDLITFLNGKIEHYQDAFQRE